MERKLTEEDRRHLRLEIPLLRQNGQDGWADTLEFGLDDLDAADREINCLTDTCRRLGDHFLEYKEHWEKLKVWVKVPYNEVWAKMEELESGGGDVEGE